MNDQEIENGKRTQALTDAGRGLAYHWLTGTVKNAATREETAAGIEVLGHAAINILAQRIMNLQKSETVGGDNVMTESQAVLMVRDMIEEELEFLKTQEPEFHNLKEKKNDNAV